MTIKIYEYQKMSTDSKQRLFKRSSSNYDEIKKQVTPLMRDVKIRGDKAVIEINSRFGNPTHSLRVSQREIKSAYTQINSKFLRAFIQAKANIERFCRLQAQSLQDQSRVENNGIKLWRVFRAIESVGIYVPGGRANYPSTLMMCAIPAILAGCTRIIVCSPANQSGELPSEVLVTANELGIKEIFKIGGSQAIAAMAYGTESITPVQKIVGPGNQYVNAAKLLVYPTTGIDLPAGPSENLIIADKSANASWIAADLITDLEHGSDSAGILLTNSPELAKNVQSEVRRLVPTISSAVTIKKALTQYSAIILVGTLTEAITFCNQYAPEHMQIVTKNALQLAAQVQNAGSVFVGPWSAKAGGDYATGANHVLPTGQSAKLYGSLSVESFGKWIEFQQVTDRGFNEIKSTIETYAEVENLPAHKLSSTIRRKT